MTERPAARAARRVCAAVLALGAALALSGCTVIPVDGMPSGTTPAPTGPAPASGSAPVTAGTAGSASPSAQGATAEGGAGQGLTLAEILEVPDLMPLLDPVPDPEVLDGLLDTALSLQSGTMTGAVVDGLTGEVLYAEDAEFAAIPASAVKVLTAVAALDVLGPDHRYATTTQARPSGSAGTEVVLRGGGDVMLGTGANTEGANGHAGLGTLAQRTAAALEEEGTAGPVTVRLDDSGYTGPGVSPDWSGDIVSSGNASTVQPIATYGGRAVPGRDTNRLHDPALYAAQVFRAALEREAGARGLEVTVAAEVSRVDPAADGTDPAEDGTELAEVESATVAEQVRHMLQTSDNQVAEAMGRNLALEAGAEGSFAGAAETIVDSLDRLGVEAEGLRLVDASGLSGANRVSAAQLTQTLQIALTSADLETSVTGLPAAGEQGTLEGRMLGTEAVGRVKAKTGTLSDVTSLTGTVRTEDGRPLLFSFIANDQPGVLDNARLAVDRAAVVLAGCGCGG